MKSKVQNPKFKIRPGSRLVRHYFLASAILIGGALVTSGIIEIYYRYQESWRSISRIQKEITASAAYKIENFIAEIENDMVAATKSRDLARDGLTAEYQWELRRLLVNVPAVSKVVAFDLNGGKQAAAMRTGSVLIKTDWQPPAPAVIDQIKRREIYHGPVSFPEGRGPFMTVAVPIERYVGEVIGVLQAEIDLKYISRVITDIQVGDAGKAYLVTRSGSLIAHPDLSLVLQKRNLAHLNQVKAAFEPVAPRAGPSTMVGQNITGAEVFYSFAQIAKLDWVIITELPIGEVYSPLYASMLRTTGLLLAGLVAALIATLLVRQRIVHPIESLRQGVERLSRGDLNTKLDLKTGDEIEVLAQEFNDMASSLKEAYADLEQKVLERTQALEISNRKLAEADKHKSQFLANVNHELRTPVSAIIGYARLLLRETEGQIAPLQKANLVDLRDNAQRLLAMVNSLLDLAKIESGKMELHAQSVNIREVIDRAINVVAPLVKQDHVRLTSEVDENLPTLITDPDKLQQILINLLANAAKFTDRGKIELFAWHEAESLRLSVKDTGIGIDTTDLEHVFEEFHQARVPSKQNFTGTGLGLAIAKKFAQILGGDITVESVVGSGSTFTVTLPFDPDQRAAA